MDLPDWFGRPPLFGPVSSLFSLLLMPGSGALCTKRTQAEDEPQNNYTSKHFFKIKYVIWLKDEPCAQAPKTLMRPGIMSTKYVGFGFYTIISLLI